MAANAHDASSAKRVDDALRAIWERRRAEVIGRLDSIETAVAALLAGGVPEDLRAAAERDAHKLAGSAGTFGFPRASELAAELEQALAAPATLGLASAPRMAELALGIRSELEGGGPLSHSDQDEHDPVLVVGAGEEAAAELAAEGRSRALRIGTCTPAEALNRAAELRPAAVLLVAGDGPDEAGVALIAALAGGPAPVPVLVSTAAATLADRVAISRAGGRAVLTTDLAARRVVDALAQAVAQGRATRPHVLALDDDPAVLEALGALLEQAGVDCAVVGTPEAFWERLAERPPDLAILDVDLPGADGIELCGVMRGDPALAPLPVLILTARTDPATLQRAFAAGADDYVPKPIVGPVLLTRISNRLERVRLYRELAERDPLTGLVNREASTAALDRFLTHAAQSGDPLALAVVDIDRFKAINDRHGHASGDLVLRGVADVLRTAFRTDDVVARWGGEEFVVGAYMMSAGGMLQRLEDALTRLQAEGVPGAGEAGAGVGFSAGVAERRAAGEDLQHLYRAADEALYRAKSAGRGRVLVAGGEESVEHVDVVLVEDDEALAEILEHAIRTAGLTVRWIDDGETARGLLGGAGPKLTARLVILDVDLPGLDGLSLLRALGRDGVLRRTRALMLTARAAEQETLAALELGAADHVAKPFSVPILMQRVRRALED